jgi:predicted metalloprotease with PDZ domain
MRHDSRATGIWLAAALAASIALAQAPEGSIAFTISMDQPNTHYLHVVMRCDGFRGQEQDFKLPVWTPGYYQIMDYARNVVNFRAEDGAGKPLAWEKTAKNDWRVRAEGAPSIVVSYDVYAFARSVADSYLDDAHAFISPTGVFMHLAGRIQHPATVTVKPYQGWARVSTGLDPVEGRANTFTAPDFDVLYDCPILAGNQEIMRFEVQGIPHTIAMFNPGSFDREKFVADLKRVVESAVSIIGEIPYKHYTFLCIGPGGGGLEHLNSAALTLNTASLNNPNGYRSWLSFVAHEYFHNYNVKRIRPIALGPFDYDKENYTNMLWVSEGISVYYQDLILVRAGLITREQYFDRVRAFLSRYENASGRLFQSATQSSFDTWIDFFSRSEHLANTTISYYDKGAALGLMLDYAIRHETRNKASLDGVMRTLYNRYYKEAKRGFTDREFRDVCEAAAGVPLPEIFDVYAPTTKDIDYRKYFAYAGLEIDVESRDAGTPWFGAITGEQGGSPVISRVEWNSPASHAGLSAQDEIVALDGGRVTARNINEMLNAKKPGDKVRVLVARRGEMREFEVTLGKRVERSFRITPMANPDPLQAEILNSVLRVQNLP